MAEDRNSRFFYGYIVVLGAFCIMLAAHGLFHSFGIFFEPLLTEFGWTRVATSGAYSLSMILIGLLTIGMGGLNGRFGPRILLTGSSFFFGLGYLLMSQIGTIWQLYLVYGQGEGSLSADLNRHHPIGCDRTFSSLLGVGKLGILTCKVGFSHPTGDGTASSDIDRDFVSNGCRHYVL